MWAREQILLEEFSHSLHRPSDVFKAVLKALHCCLLGDPCRVNDLVGSFTTSMKIIARTFEGPISEYYIDLVVESLGGIAKVRELVESLKSGNWNPKPRRRRSSSGEGKLPSIWGVGSDGIAQPSMGSKKRGLS